MTLLLLAGSGEARRIASILAQLEIPAIATLAGATQDPAKLDLPVFSGGFGGEEGFRQFLETHQISAILDATHPFADRISHRSARIAAEIGLPFAQVMRPEWHPEPGDNWLFLDQEQDLAKHVPMDAVVFLGTGANTLDKFSNLSPRKVICRRIDTPRKPFPFANGEWMIGRPPFSIEDEIALFQLLGVSWLVVKNSGGTASRSKLDAARKLGIRVALLNRPPPLPGVTRLETVDAAIDWVESL